MLLTLKKIVKPRPPQKKQNRTPALPLIFTQNLERPEIDPLRQKTLIQQVSPLVLITTNLKLFPLILHYYLSEFLLNK